MSCPDSSVLQPDLIERRLLLWHKLESWLQTEFTEKYKTSEHRVFSAIDCQLPEDLREVSLDIEVDSFKLLRVSVS